MKNSRFKKIFVTPIYWSYVSTLLIDAALKFFFKEQYNIAFSFLVSIVYGFLDYCVAVKLREVIGFGPISYLRAMKIGVVSALKLCCVPIIFIILIVSVQTYFQTKVLTNSSLDIKENIWFSLLISIAFSWIIVGMNYAFFTNNTSNLIWRTFSIVKSMPKKIGEVLISYIVLITIGVLARKIVVLDIFAGVFILLITSVPLRAWLYEIFNEHHGVSSKEEPTEDVPVI